MQAVEGGVEGRGGVDACGRRTRGESRLRSTASEEELTQWVPVVVEFCDACGRRSSKSRRWRSTEQERVGGGGFRLLNPLRPPLALASSSSRLLPSPEEHDDTIPASRRRNFLPPEFVEEDTSAPSLCPA